MSFFAEENTSQKNLIFFLEMTRLMAKYNKVCLGLRKDADNV